ncbi:hypothetical protein AAMO2058_000726900 [Amorphochlora amoebiformis]
MPHLILISGPMRWEWRQVPKVTESQLNLSYSAPVRPMTWMPFDDKTSDKIECAYGSGKERLRCRVPSLVDPDTGKKEKVLWSFNLRLLKASSGRVKASVDGSSGMNVYEIRRIQLPSAVGGGEMRRSSVTLANQQKSGPSMPRLLTPECSVFISGELYITAVRALDVGGRMGYAKTIGRSGRGKTARHLSLEVVDMQSDDAEHPKRPKLFFETPPAVNVGYDPVWGHTIRVPIHPTAEALKIKVHRKRSVEARVVVWLAHILPFLNPLISGARPETEVKGKVFHHRIDQANECANNVLEAWFDMMKDASGKPRDKSYGKLHLAFRFVPHRASFMWKWHDDDGKESSSNLRDSRRNSLSALTATGPVSWATARKGWGRGGRAQAAKEALRVFGVPIERAAEAAHSYFPSPCYDCVEFLTEYALKTEGLFRVSGDMKKINQIKIAYDSHLPSSTLHVASTHGSEGNQTSTIRGSEFGGGVSGGGPSALLSSDHEAAGLLKLYFRELPESLVPPRQFDRFLQIASDHKNAMDKADKKASHKAALTSKTIKHLTRLVAEMPAVNRTTLQYLMAFLEKVSNNSNVNMMTPNNLAIVWAPTLVRPSNPMDSRAISTISDIIDGVRFLITHQLRIFGPVSEPAFLPSSLSHSQPRRRRRAHSSVGIKVTSFTPTDRLRFLASAGRPIERKRAASENLETAAKSHSPTRLTTMNGEDSQDESNLLNSPTSVYSLASNKSSPPKVKGSESQQKALAFRNFSESKRIRPSESRAQKEFAHLITMPTNPITRRPRSTSQPARIYNVQRARSSPEVIQTRKSKSKSPSKPPPTKPPTHPNKPIIQQRNKKASTFRLRSLPDPQPTPSRHKDINTKASHSHSEVHSPLSVVPRSGNNLARVQVPILSVEPPHIPPPPTIQTPGGLPPPPAGTPVSMRGSVEEEAKVHKEHRGHLARGIYYELHILCLNIYIYIYMYLYAYT